ncbi:ABC transporter G family member 20 [Orchesella cincta]|uniref:ABC transporter G family member 20 n=1 Tax=Orchesella cincta TaxID=48709 RepID=A0A1D2N552_ORCCI|nr:ABC transporter G family member 20 [Orchesella cincta]
MRSGRLLAEKNPNELMNDYGFTLEKVVMRLCRKDTALKLDPEDLAEVLRRRDEVDANTNKTKNPVLDVQMASVIKVPETGVKDTMVRIKALTGKNFAILSRNLILLSFVIWIPVFLCSLICLAIGNDPTHINFGLINDELDYSSVCPTVTRIAGECNIENLSCQYLRQIPDDTVNLKIFKTVEEAVAAVHDGKIWGFIKFPEDFSGVFWERSATGANVDEMVLNASEIIVRLDESSKQIAAPLKKALYDAFEDFIAELLSDCGFDRRQGESVLQFNEPIFGTDNTDFREYIAPSIAVGIIFFFPIITSAIRYIQEKKCGMFERSLVAGVNVWEIMVAYSISEFCVLVLQALLTYLVLTLVFKIKVLGAGILIVITYLLSGYGGVSMGFMFGSFCTEEIQAAMLAMAAFFPNFILSGLIWPVEGMPVALQYVAKALPCTLSSEAVRSVVSRGWEFGHPNVWPGFAILIGYIIGYFILTILIHKIIKR